MTIREVLNKIHIKYNLSPLDAEILLSLVGNMSKEYIWAHPEKKLSLAQVRKFNSFCWRRAKGEPIAYISGKKESYGLEFLVNSNVLIPRPETELLVEETIEKINSFFCHPALDAGSRNNFFSLDSRFRGNDKMALLDVGTGSGNIIISIIKNLPEKVRKKINFYAIDISKESLKVARVNAKKHKVHKKINFIQSDLLEYFLPPKADQSLTEKNKKFKNIFIVANLPYASLALYNKNNCNLKFEPRAALFSQHKGLAHYEKMLQQARFLIADHCSLFLEISPEQKPGISRIMKKYLPKATTKFFKDLAGKWRMVEIETSP